MESSIMEIYKLGNACKALSQVALATSLSFSPVGLKADNSNSNQHSDSDEKTCKRFVSNDKTTVILNNCSKADIDLITDDGSRIRIKSKGKSNSINVRIGK